MVTVVLSAFGFEVVYSHHLGAGLPEGYLLLCAALAVGAALLLAGFATLARIPASLAMALPIALHGSLLGWPWARVFAFGLITAAGVRLFVRLPANAFRDGVIVGAAWCVAWVFGPRLALRAGLEFGAVVAGGFFAATLAGGALYCFTTGRWRRLPPLVAIVLAGLSGIALLAYRGSEPIEIAVPWREAPRTGGEAAAPADVILLVLDTVRADHLSIYGYERDTTPQLRAFLERSDRAVLYPLAFTPASWTGPAHASLFTGRMPSEHGAHYGTFFKRGPTSGAPIVVEQTLAEALRTAGYATAAVFANSGLFWVEGLGRGFDLYDQPPYAVRPRVLGERIRARLLPQILDEVLAPYPTAPSINRALLATLKAAEGRPRFVVANYMEAHEPYVPASPWGGTFSSGLTGTGLSLPAIEDDAQTLEWLAARYDEEILALDASLGELLVALEADGTLDRSWLFITSDHGEAFAEHGVTGHGAGVHNEQIRVPLLVQPPRGITLPQATGAVGLLDVTATVAGIAGVASPGTGRDLRIPLPAGHAVQAEFFGDSREFKQDYQGALVGEPARAVMIGTRKLIELQGARSLFDLEADPAEEHDLAAGRPADAGTLEGRLPPLLREPARGGAGKAELTPEQEEALRQLGYIQ
ncbi:MAG: sulfatase [Deltaproteobacteria bacterium]|nr:sulfatase [Deltaproteobacteria bacterium]